MSFFEERTDEKEIDNYAKPTFYMYKVYLRKIKILNYVLSQISLHFEKACFFRQRKVLNYYPERSND